MNKFPFLTKNTLRKTALFLLFSITLYSPLAPLVSAHDYDDSSDEKITICHATHSETNPYVEITISKSALNAHDNHQDDEDIIPAPAEGCPGNNGDHHNTAPVITILGNNPAEITVGNSYTDSGATALDQEDGDITSSIIASSTVNTSIVGSYTVKYDVKDSEDLSAPEVIRIVNVVSTTTTGNHPPVITLIGDSTQSVTLGNTFTDPGVTANDLEDGNITANIITSGTVNTAQLGAYTLTYTVTDSGNLSTSTTRVVNVVPAIIPLPENSGKISFCLMITDNQNVVATNSTGLPNGAFSLNLATSTDFSTSTINTKNWDSTTFVPNRMIISGQDADCVTFDNLALGVYYYSELNVSGSQWSTPKYNDQNTQSINNIFDFFDYTPQLFTATTSDDELRNTNSDGQIILVPGNDNRTLVILNKFNPVTNGGGGGGENATTSNISINKTVDKSTANVGDTITYTITVSNAGPKDATNVNASDVLPSGISFVSSSSTIGSYATTTGIWNIGNLANGSSTALTLVGTIGNNTQGQKITNTAVASSTEADSDTSNNTSSVDINVNNSNNGGGGGGGNTPNSNLSVTKIADKSSANVGDTVTYTITVSNSGPTNATGVNASDVLPSTLDFVSATSSLGNYATTTGMWNIGDLANGSSTTLTLVATIKSGTEGQKITNTAVASSTVSDSDTSNNTGSADTTVNNPTSTGNGGGGGGGGTGGGGGGGGGNGPIVGTFGVSNNGGGGGQVLGETSGSENSCDYLHDYLRKDFNNNPAEVLKLQVFLRDLEGFNNLDANGVYDDNTIVAVNAFQVKYKDDVLIPWGYDGTTGTSYTYILTKKKVNEIYCKKAFPLTAQQEEEINAHRNFFLNLRGNSGSTDLIPQAEQESGNTLGQSTTSGYFNSALSTLAGVSSTTRNIANILTANVLSSGKKLRNLVMALLIWPFGPLFKKTVNACTTGYNFCKLLNMLLILLIIIISVLWYKGHKRNKKIEEINKEIDASLK